MASQLNIVYLHSHDTGRYVQPYGHAIRTPHLQQLAEQGVLFRQAFCAAPTCSPSRASLLTGQSPHSVGMLGLAHRGHRLHDYGDVLIHTLHEHGYTSALTWFQHIARGSGVGPEDIGYHRLLNEQGGDDATAEAAVGFLHDSPEQPFFLDVGFFMTHRTHIPEEDMQWHNGDGSPLGDPRYVQPPAPLPDTPETRRDFADYTVCAERFDECVGRVLRAIDEAGLADNTLVIATTDHGIAFPGCKCNLTDHGMGVMLIMRGPDESGFTGGKVIDGLVSQIDLFPTICDLTGIEPPDRLEGRSIMPLVRGEREQVNEAVFAEVTHHAAYEPKRAVRTERWKYIRRFDTRRTPVLPNCDNSVSKTVWYQHGWAEQELAEEYLFDLMLDPNETNNLADSPAHTEVREAMRGRLDAWMRETEDPLLHGSLADLPGIRRTPQDAYSPSDPAEEIPADR